MNPPPSKSPRIPGVSCRRTRVRNGKKPGGFLPPPPCGLWVRDGWWVGGPCKLMCKRSGRAGPGQQVAQRPRSGRTAPAQRPSSGSEAVARDMGNSSCRATRAELHMQTYICRLLRPLGSFRAARPRGLLADRPAGQAIRRRLTGWPAGQRACQPGGRAVSAHPGAGARNPGVSCRRTRVRDGMKPPGNR